MIAKALCAFGAMALVGVGLAVTTPINKPQHAVMQYDGKDTFVYPSLEDAAVISNIDERIIYRSIRTGNPVDSLYFVYIK